jgi:ABC-type transport system substrate-binding protein
MLSNDNHFVVGGMKLRIMLGSGLVALTALLSGCGGSSSTGTGSVALNATPASVALSHSPVTIARSSDITSLNPQELNISEDYETQQALYAGLVRVSANGKKIESDLASSWSFDQRTLTYTFKLRPGLEFSNGTPITSADIIYSIEYAAKGAEYAPLFGAIRSVTAPGPNEIEIKLSRYSNLVLPGLAFAFVLPLNLDGEKPVDFFKDPVSSGEFQLSSWDPGNQMVLKPNPYYWDHQAVDPASITFRIIPDENARLNALLAGDVNLNEYVPDEQVPALANDELLESKPRSTLVMLVTNNGRAPFNSQVNRQAAALAIDRPLILETIWDSDGAPMQGLIPPGLPESHSTPIGPEAWEYDPAKARALLAGTHPSVDLLASYERGIDSSLVDVLQRELQEAGFQVHAQVLDFASAVPHLLSGEFSMFLTPQSSFLPTAGEVMTAYATLVAPFAHWNAAQAEGFVTRFGGARSLEGRKQAAVAFERWNHAGFVANPIGNPYVFFGIDKHLRGLQITPFGTYRLGTLQLEK